MRQLREIAEIVRGLRRRLRFGRMARAAEPMDGSLAREVRDGQESSQALAGAIAVRHRDLDALAKIDCAVLRGFRQPAREPPGRISPGTVSREMLRCSESVPW
jgi:hypothetical protein